MPRSRIARDLLDPIVVPQVKIITSARGRTPLSMWLALVACPSMAVVAPLRPGVVTVFTALDAPGRPPSEHRPTAQAADRFPPGPSRR
ncbi:hypothetical protein SSAG_01379 [Streptomyces sp. Mg1]|nr:hypothetical protein SSAG_01379 [Streptomyces sp. Mg1]